MLSVRSQLKGVNLCLIAVIGNWYKEGIGAT